MIRVGSSSARSRIAAPVFSSPESLFFAAATASMARSSATPPPGTMPSSTAARVAESASSTRSFFSFSSTSVAAPTLMHGHAARQLRQPLLQLLAVEVRCRVVGLRLDLLDAVLDRLIGAVALDDGGLVLGRT